MTHSYALRRLLEHGQMTQAEIVTCTGWSVEQVAQAIADLRTSGLIRRRLRDVGRGGGYAFEAAPPPVLGPSSEPWCAGNSKRVPGLFHDAAKGVK